MTERPKIMDLSTVIENAWRAGWEVRTQPDHAFLSYDPSHLEAYQRLKAVCLSPPAPEAPALPTGPAVVSLQSIDRARAKALLRRRALAPGSDLHAEFSEIIDALDAATLTIHAQAARLRGAGK